MKLLTKANLASLPPLGATENEANATIHVKFFCPWNQWTWYATEFSPEEGLFFGLVKGFEQELGYFSLAELEAVRGPMGMRIERDRYFTPCTISEVR